jgi:guanosine-diphosphatase
LNLQSCTPLSLKATAGLRQIGTEKSDLILKNVRIHLETNFPFPIADHKSGDGVSLMDGTDEGVYAWITVNYLNNRLGQPNKYSTGTY